MSTTFADNDETRDSDIHAERTVGLTKNEKDSFNEGYLWASADAIKVMSRILDEEDFTDSERVQAFESVVDQMSVPLLIASIASEKNFLG